MFYNWKSELLIWIGVVIYSRGQRAHRLASRWENFTEFPDWSHQEHLIYMHPEVYTTFQAVSRIINH